MAKDIVKDDTIHTIYGKEVHKAAEDYVKEGTAIPAKYPFLMPVLTKLDRIAGERLAEHEFAVTEDYAPCNFDSDKAWWRGIADLMILNTGAKKLSMFDYKTGKPRYADPTQLDYMATAAFYNYPEIDHIKAALLFVVHDSTTIRKYSRDNLPEYTRKMTDATTDLQSAYMFNVWNPKSNPFCKNCKVKDCVYKP